MVANAQQNGVILSLRTIRRGADDHSAIVAPHARSFGTEVPQDDAVMGDFFKLRLSKRKNGRGRPFPILG